MTEVSRRSFLIRSSATLAAAGAVAAIPAGAVRLADSREKTNEALTPEEASALSSLVVHVANPATGELSVMVGTEEVHITDHRLVARLASMVRATR
jgi:anaerobic selenocysteine-containing dehydrogenase